MSHRQTPGATQRSFRRLVSPREKTELIVHHDPSETGREVRETRLLEVARHQHLVLCQPRVPFTRADLHKDLDVTFLARMPSTDGVRHVRVGYAARIISLLPPKDPGGLDRDGRILVSTPTKLRAYDLRLHQRLVPPLGTQVHVVNHEMLNLVDAWFDRVITNLHHQLLSGVKPAGEVIAGVSRKLKGLGNNIQHYPRARSATVMDISLGGIRLAHTTDLIFPDPQSVDFILSWGNHTAFLKARIVRGGPLPDSVLTDGRYTCLQYRDQEVKDKLRLKRILEQMRQATSLRRAG